MYLESEIYGSDADGNRGVLVHNLVIEGSGDTHERDTILNQFIFNQEAIYGTFIVPDIEYGGYFFDEVEFDTSEYFTEEEIEEMNIKLQNGEDII